ncbi:hypothetical protein [Ornithinimicrobium kibberense]|uniref:hypothetical protein n=1 Tax=Ornithinimicrobium kibberense TaxID=282060 RepID=UPI0036112118
MSARNVRTGQSSGTERADVPASFASCSASHRRSAARSRRSPSTRCFRMTQNRNSSPAEGMSAARTIQLSSRNEVITPPA